MCYAPEKTSTVHFNTADKTFTRSARDNKNPQIKIQHNLNHRKALGRSVSVTARLTNLNSKAQ